MKIPLDNKIQEIQDIPHTISFVIRKRQQVDGFNELPKDKRPPELMIWDGTPEEINERLEEVFSGKSSPVANIVIDKVER